MVATETSADDRIHAVLQVAQQMDLLDGQVVQETVVATHGELVNLVTKNKRKPKDKLFTSVATV